MDLKKEFSTNEKLELDGVWEEIDEGARLLIGRAFNENFTRTWRGLPAGVRRRIDKGTISQKKDTELFSELIANSILLDWEGLTDNGELLVYSKEVAKKMLIQYKEFRSLVWELANDAQLFKDVEMEDDVKN